jgi:autotransporter-associated beta strand protein
VVANADALQDTTLDFSSGALIFAPGTTAATFGALQGTDTGQNLVLSSTSGPVALSVGGNDSVTIYSDNLSGPGSLTETGPGALTLTDANYTGATTVDIHGILTISGGSFGSPSSQIYVGNPIEPGSNAVATLNLTGGLATAGAFNIGIVGGETGSSASITGNASGSFGGVQLGSGQNTGGSLTISTTGTVSLGAYAMGRDGSSGEASNTSGGLIINAGAVTATSILSAAGVSGRTADINLNGGTLTVGNSASTGAFQLTSNVGAGSGAGNGIITQTGGSLTYLGTDGLLCDTQNDNSDADVSTFTITGATSVDTFTGITLNAASAANATARLSISGGATLYLGSVGLVENQPGATVSASLGTATVGAIANWTSSAPITLTGNTTFQTADPNGVPHNITLAGILSGGGGLTETGSGTLTLAGNNTYTGATSVAGGILEITGTLASTTSVTVASGAVLYLAGGSLPISGAITNNGIFKESGTAVLGAGAFVNNGVLDLINGPQSLPANFTNNGTVLNASSVQVRQLSLSNSNGFALTVQGYAQHTYQLQRATSLTAPITWTNVGASQAGAGSTLTFTDSSAAGTQGFYKVQVSP